MRGLGSCASGEAHDRGPGARHEGDPRRQRRFGERRGVQDRHQGADRDDRSARDRDDPSGGRATTQEQPDPRGPRPPRTRPRWTNADRTPRRPRTPSRCRTGSTAGGWPEPPTAINAPTPASARERIAPPAPRRQRSHHDHLLAQDLGQTLDAHHAPAHRHGALDAQRPPAHLARGRGGPGGVRGAPFRALDGAFLGRHGRSLRRRPSAFGPRDSVERHGGTRRGAGVGLRHQPAGAPGRPGHPAPPGAGPVRPAEREGPRSRRAGGHRGRRDRTGRVRRSGGLRPGGPGPLPGSRDRHPGERRLHAPAGFARARRLRRPLAERPPGPPAVVPGDARRARRTWRTA